MSSSPAFFAITWFSLSLVCAPQTRTTASATSQDSILVEHTLQTNENSLWEAWKKHDSKAYDELLSDDAIDIGAYGSLGQGRAAVLQGVVTAYCAVRSYGLSDFHYVWLDDDSVMQIYTAHTDASCGGHRLPDTIIASTLWQRRAGKWLSRFHQESPKQ
ncbi:MAG TPA: nuclear transport factor 2 family protein [Terriglobales bacterium]